MPHPAAPPTPLLIAIAELDPPLFHRQALDLSTAAYEAWGLLPSLVRLAAHNHYSEIFGFNTPYRPRLEAAMLAFLEDVLAPREV